MLTHIQVEDLVAPAKWDNPGRDGLPMRSNWRREPLRQRATTETVN
jgi:hypothetical protein